MAPGGVIFLCDKASEDSSLLPLWEKVILAKRGSDEGSLSAETDPSPVTMLTTFASRRPKSALSSSRLPQGERGRSANPTPAQSPDSHNADSSAARRWPSYPRRRARYSGRRDW